MKAITLLIVLLALAFSVQAEDVNDTTYNDWFLANWEIDVDDTTATSIDWTLADWEITALALWIADSTDAANMADTAETVEVYYIDTVGWKLTFDNRTVTLLEDEGVVPVVDSVWCRLFGEPLLEPVTKTVIVGHFRTDKTAKIRKWRVREK